MELNEIIIYASQIFFVSASVVIVASYLIYRFKRKSRGIQRDVNL